MPDLCWLCLRPATGLASLTTPRLGEIRLCHGDDDEEPTCYQRFAQVAMQSMGHDVVPADILAALPDAEIIPFPTGRVR